MSRINVKQLEQAMANVIVALGREWEEIVAEYERLGLGRGRVTNRRLDMRLKENRRGPSA